MVFLNVFARFYEKNVMREDVKKMYAIKDCKVNQICKVNAYQENEIK